MNYNLSLESETIFLSQFLLMELLGTTVNHEFISCMCGGNEPILVHSRRFD